VSDNEKPLVTLVFVQDTFLLGGIEILEIKLIEYLSRKGYSVVVACRDNDFLEKSASYNFFAHSGYPDLISRADELVPEDTNKVIFVSFQPIAALASEIISRSILKKRNGKIIAHHFHWVSHSRAFIFSEKRAFRLFFRKLFAMLPYKSTYFMNDAALAAHQSFWRRPLTRYPVLRIIGRMPTAIYPCALITSSAIEGFADRSLRIVSVGRLVAFKSYNMNAASVIRQLRGAGINATWDIWGYGPDEAAITSSIEEHGVMAHVRLRGTLPHSIFDETVSSYDVFVGMGTAVLEAAKTGMPVCVAVENRGDACYGHLHEAPTDSVGDRVEGFPERSLYEVLATFAELGTKERIAIGQKDAAAARLRESTLDEFVTAIVSAAPITEADFFDRTWLSIGKGYLLANYFRHKALTF